MPWFLVDDAFPTHPRVLATSLSARGLWVTVGSWSSAHRTDGAVRDHELASLGGTPELAAELVTAGLWRRVRGGYQFAQDGTCKIPSREAVERGRKSKAGRQARYRAKQRAGDAPVDGGVDARVDAVDNSFQNRPPQNGRSPTHGRRPVDASTRASPGPDPDPLPVVDLIGQLANGDARASPDMIDMIINEIRGKTGRTIDAGWAARVAAEVLRGRHPASPVAYVRKAIRDEADPRTRFLPIY